MICYNGQCYLPQPPRAWSRVQNSCTFENGADTNTNANTMVRLPYSNKEVPASTLGKEIAMINKGNVLQYKKNSSSLTKNQRYSKIAQGQWTNRTKTFASQSTRGYTNPNTQSLMRVGGSNVTTTGQPTDLPVTCPTNIRPINYVLPLQVSNIIINQVLPPPPPPPPGGGTGNVMPMVDVPIEEPVVIQDFGNLVCGTQEDLCTGLLITSIKLDNCHPTTDSDVPGQIQDLCWNDGNPTWYPRQQYVMTNSTDKWPVNAPLVSAVRPATPVLTLTIASGINTLSWITTTDCLPISSYNVYQNNLLIANTTNMNYIVNVTNTSDTFYVISLSGTIESNPSNIVSQNNPNLLTTSSSTSSSSSSTSSSSSSTSSPSLSSSQNPFVNSVTPRTIVTQSTNRSTATNTNTTTTTDTTSNIRPNIQVIETVPTIGYFEMPTLSSNLQNLLLFNRTNELLLVQSDYKIYNQMYYPNGSYTICVPANSYTDFIYINKNNIITIFAKIS